MVREVQAAGAVLRRVVTAHIDTLVGGGCLIPTRPRSVPYKKETTQIFAQAPVTALLDF